MILAKNISKSYKRKILDDISFEIEKFALVGIAGKNGSGKSTLLKILTGNVQPDFGEVYINNKNLFKDYYTVSKNIGYVSQENSLFNNLSVKDNIIFFYNLHKIKKLDFFNLPQKTLKTKIINLSGGEKKRINFLISMMNNPEYIFLDEPTANLDIYYKNKMMEKILEYKNQNKTIVLTSHDTKELKICDKILLINENKIEFQGSVKDFNNEEEFENKIYDLIKNSNKFAEVENGR